MFFIGKASIALSADSPPKGANSLTKDRGKLLAFSLLLASLSLAAIQPAHAEYEATVEYLRPKFVELIKKAASKDIDIPMPRNCSNIAITGLATWSDDEESEGKPFYVWFPDGISVPCWEYLKESLPKQPFELVKGVTKSRITRISFNPFSDPGPTIFFFFQY